jgi:hypothetical protein
MTHVKAFENKVQVFYHSKVHNYILVKAFGMKFSNLWFFPFIYEIVNPYEIYFQYIENFHVYGKCKWLG